MYKKILFSVDLSDDASWQKALPAALQHCQAFDAELHVLTVVPELPMGVVNLYFADDAGARLVKAAKEDWPTSSRNAFRSASGSSGMWRTAPSTPASRYGRRHRCRPHHHGLARPAMRDYLLGPNAARVVRHSTRSVLVVRA